MKNIAIVAALAAAVAAVPASAQETAEIYFGDLDVASAAGTQALNARVNASADAVCERPANRNLKAVLAWQECKDAVMTSAVEQLASKGITLAN